MPKVAKKSETLGSFPFPRLSAPLTLSSPPAIAFGEIDDSRRIDLRTQRHFLLRGTVWLNKLEISVSQLHASPLRKGILDQLPSLGPDWQTFSEGWEYQKNKEEGGNPDLGKTLISEYISHNEPNSPYRLTYPEARFLTYFRAAGLFAFFQQFLVNWFAVTDPGKRKSRYQTFRDQYGGRFQPDFLYRNMAVEPIIYKHGSLSDDQYEALFGTLVRRDPAALRINEEFLRLFEARIDMPWSEAIVAKNVIAGIFAEERSADYAFMKAVSAVTAEFLKLQVPLKVRHGQTYNGPTKGIVVERFLDIRVQPRPWEP